jgi:poly(3-hydroxybutyrate) depolymerase
MRIATLPAAFIICLALPATAAPQALTSLSSLRTSYNTRKATVRPEGELKSQIDANDQAVAAATRQGQLGEVRRLIAKGQALLAGRTWTSELDFENSLVLRTEHVVADSAKPYEARIEQIYSPSIELTRSLTAQARLQKRPAAAIGRGGAAAPAPEVVKDFGTATGVSRDLRESPFRLVLDVHDVADGTYQLTVDVLDGERPLGTTTLAINLRKGLDDTVARLEAAAAKAPEALRAEILFPVDRMRNVNRGRLEMRTFDPDRDFAAALDVAAAATRGTDPFAKRTGDFKRHYLLQTANEIMPYHLYVPTSYNGSRAFPLIIALHGLGGTEDSFFTGYDRLAPSLAEQHGYILAAPLGYRVDGGYGWGVGNPPADPVTRASQQASEDDVMQVLKVVQQQYKVDPSRIYLMGHSLGAIGTWKIAPKFPDVWAAIAPFSGSGNAASLERLKTVPEIVVHGDDDRTVNVRGSRTMVAKMKELGIEHKYIEVPGGSHGGVVAPNLPAVFDFFDAHKKK